MMALALAATSGSLLGLGFGELVIDRAARHREASPSPRRSDGSLLATLLSLSSSLGRRAGRRLPTPTDAAARLDAAGLAPGVTPADLGAWRGTAVIVAVAATAVLLPVIGAGAVVLAGVVLTGLVVLPDLWIARRIRTRAQAMLVELPDTIDLLRITLRSGRSVPETLARVGAHHPGAVGRELRHAAAEMRIGVATDRALVHLRRRCPAEGVPELIAVLLRAHRHGGAAAEGLQALAEDLRARRSRAAIDQAARAAPKIQLVVALLLVPAAMLLIAAALLQMRT